MNAQDFGWIAQIATVCSVFNAVSSTVFRLFPLAFIAEIRRFSLFTLGNWRKFEGNWLENAQDFNLISQLASVCLEFSTVYSSVYSLFFLAFLAELRLFKLVS